MSLYVYKFLYSFILPPGIIIVSLVCFCVWLLCRRYQKQAVFIGIVTFTLYSISTWFISGALLKTLENRYNPPQNVTGDVIILLGGGATADTPDIDGIGNLSGSAANRLLTAARIQRKLGVPIIVSGGQVFEDSGKEAIIAKRILLGIGISEDKIILEDRSLNTKQNAIFTKEILQRNGYAHPILVTSAFHMDRAVINFNKQGVDVLPYPSDYITSIKGSINANSFAPSGGALDASCIYFREVLGIVATRLIH